MSGRSTPYAGATPSPGTCVAHGHISLKTKALFSSKFRPGYWTLVYPSNLIIFASKKDMALWLSSPYRGNGINQSAVDVLDPSVKALINLDPSGIIQRRERRERRRLEKEASSSSSSSRKHKKAKGKKSAGKTAADAAAQYAERYSLVSDQDHLMHVLNINVENSTGRGGTRVALCVGSTDPQEVTALREALESTLALIDGDGARCNFIAPADATQKEENATCTGRPPRPTVCTPKQQSISKDASPDDSFESIHTSLSAPLPRIAESVAGSGSETRSAVSAAS
jgi:hypothetical protein